MGTDYYLSITQQLAAAGLTACGYFLRRADDDLAEQAAHIQSIIMVGQTTENWHYFEQSAEFHDHRPNPLDRYAFRVCQAIAADYRGQVFMPSDGPPFYPFQQWAQRADTVYPSALGLLIHPQYGLWHAYRAAIGLPLNLAANSVAANSVTVDTLAAKSAAKLTAPCQACDKPCLGACPVNAFSVQGYDVAACKNYLHTTPEAICHTQGCQARVACPVGKAHEYQPSHKRFLMQAFSG